VVLANGTIEATRLALSSLGVGDTRFGALRLGNLMAHLRSNITVRIKRGALGLPPGAPPDLETTAFLVRGATGGQRFHFQVAAAAVAGRTPSRTCSSRSPTSTSSTGSGPTRTRAGSPSCCAASAR
jgi:hypothetical protein